MTFGQPDRNIRLFQFRDVFDECMCLTSQRNTNKNKTNETKKEREKKGMLKQKKMKKNKMVLGERNSKTQCLQANQLAGV